MKVDVVVIGSGPAGLAAAAACGRSGLSVAIVSPTMMQPWPNRYGVFVDDTVVDVPAHRTFDQVAVRTVDWQSFPRPYHRVDESGLRDNFLRACSESGIAALHGSVESIVYHRSHHRVHWSEGELYCKAVIDASGHRSEFIEREEEPWSFQTAFGLLIRTEEKLLSHDCVLMDWAEDEQQLAPSFLYGMQMADDSVFLEETVLISAEIPTFESLEKRLLARLEGVDFEIIEEERCLIPMAGGLPTASNRCIPFGGAATMVHPATGYLLSRVLNTAPTLAATIRTHIAAHTTVISEHANEIVWSDDARKRYSLLQFGGQFLATCNGDELRSFFDAFFEMDSNQWGAFMAGDLSSDDVAKTMLAVFKNANLTTKAKLVSAGLKHPKKLVSGLF